MQMPKYTHIAINVKIMITFQLLEHVILSIIFLKPNILHVYMTLPQNENIALNCGSSMELPSDRPRDVMCSWSCDKTVASSDSQHFQSFKTNFPIYNSSAARLSVICRLSKS